MDLYGKRPSTSGLSPAPKKNQNNCFTGVRSRSSQSPTQPGVLGNDHFISDVDDLTDVLSDLENSFSDNSAHQVASYDGSKGREAGDGVQTLLVRIVTALSNVGCAGALRFVAKAISYNGELIGNERILDLRGFWTQADIQEGSDVKIVRLLTDCRRSPIEDIEEFVFKDRSPDYLLIVNPDVLVPATLLASSLFCQRKAIFGDRIRGIDSSNVAMFVGNVCHSVFQSAIASTSSDPGTLRYLAEEFMSDFDLIGQLFSLGLDQTRLWSEVNAYLKQISGFIDKHIVRGESLISSAKPQLRIDYQNPNELKIDKILDIEENIWCPDFGIRGKTDLTVAVKCGKKNFRNNQIYVGTKSKPKLDRDGDSFVVPMELKTGKVSFSAEHKGQLALYTLMIRSVYGEDCRKGILLYMKDGSYGLMENDCNSISALIQLRNQLSTYLCTSAINHSFDVPLLLPEPVNNQRTCGYCPYLTTCYLFEKSYEKQLPDDHGLIQLAQKQLNHIKPSHLDYFELWFRNCMLEWGSDLKRRARTSDLWIKPVADRVKAGFCVSGLKICKNENVSKSAWRIVLRSSSKLNIDSTNISSKDLVVLSNPSKFRYALAIAPIVGMTSESITLSLDKCLVYNIADEFCIDKYESNASTSIGIGCFLSIFNDTPLASKIRALVIEMRPPSFETGLHKSVITIGKPILRVLNKEQVRAVLRVLMAKDYALIHGMPGSGKTTTICRLLSILAALKKSVLLVSYTHSAVDNILLKLNDLKLPPILRLGRESQVHPACRRYLVCSHVPDQGLSFTQKHSAVTQLYDSVSIVAGTFFSVASCPILKRRTFDYVIVDEASQALQTVTFPAIMAAQKFVLVGDPLQLSPVIVSREAKEAGMGESLFARLSVHSDAVIALPVQYRMNRTILNLSNELVYGGSLSCADEAVACNVMAVTANAVTGSGEETAPEWATRVLSCALDEAVVFVNTEHISNPYHTKQKAGLLHNDAEAEIAGNIVALLVKNGLKNCDIGVIGVYRHQVDCINKYLSINSCPAGHTGVDDENNCSSLDQVEVNTADQYQGRDKNVIVVSMTWSQAEEQGSKPRVKSEEMTGTLLDDMKRLNVIMTRAKQKLIFIGHVPSLRQFLPVQQLLAELKPNQLVKYEKPIMP